MFVDKNYPRTCWFDKRIYFQNYTNLVELDSEQLKHVLNFSEFENKISSFRKTII